MDSKDDWFLLFLAYGVPTILVFLLVALAGSLVTAIFAALATPFILFGTLHAKMISHNWRVKGKYQKIQIVKAVGGYLIGLALIVGASLV